MTQSKDILVLIKKTVESEELISVSELADKIGSNWSTTKHNIELLEALGIVKTKHKKNTIFVLSCN